MKELSIEEKAKRYDEALERAKKINIEHSKRGFKSSDDVLYIFPELVDEIIREEIIDFLRLPHPQFVGKRNHEEWIAWLEKQGEQPKKRNVCDNCEQQGSCISPCWVKLAEKNDEQKPVVETKLKIKGGKWYVCIRDLLDNYANKAFYKGYIYLSTQNGSLIPSNSNVPFEVVCPDTYFKDWTIQDAKDGDVLAVGNIIFIYKRTLANHIVSYCKLINDAFESTSDARTCCEGNTYVHPTTKKQRDTFFAKMRESGYEWDAKEKELKKIEQKPTQFTPEQADVLDKHIDKFLEQKLVWSEDDEEMYKKVETAIDSYYAPFSRDTEEMQEWFKNLKNRAK